MKNVKFYVYEDGELVGEEVMRDLNDYDEISEVMIEYFESEDWDREDDGDEIWIGVSECEYMVNKKY